MIWFLSTSKIKPRILENHTFPLWDKITCTLVLSILQKWCFCLFINLLLTLSNVPKVSNPYFADLVCKFTVLSLFIAFYYILYTMHFRTYQIVFFKHVPHIQFIFFCFFSLFWQIRWIQMQISFTFTLYVYFPSFISYLLNISYYYISNTRIVFCSNRIYYQQSIRFFQRSY